ncbi:MAG TPA: E3 binding domain-containing protein, partial [Terrimesophilobacter sp.]|nr:E3 binding domain-containing protein [Terrimesophilobacter sp.]
MATTSKDFILPDLGEGLTEAEIVNWLVAVGDTVVVDQPIIEVESAKSVVELPCPFAGVVEKLHAAVGDTIHSGQPIITVGVEGGSEPDVASAPSSTTAKSRRPAPSGRFGRRNTGSAAASPPESGARGVAATAASPSPRRLDDDGAVSPVVSPLVRKLAHEHGFAANTLQGTGTGGLVLRADVERVIAQGGHSAAGSAPASASAPGDAPRPIASADGDIRIPITGLRKIVAERMTASRRDVPEATIWLDVDATELLAAKEQLQKSTGDRWSLNALLARFVV